MNGRKLQARIWPIPTAEEPPITASQAGSAHVNQCQSGTTGQYSAGWTCRMPGQQAHHKSRQGHGQEVSAGHSCQNTCAGRSTTENRSSGSSQKKVSGH